MVGDKRAVIKNSQLFWNLSDKQIDKLVDICEEKKYDAGLHVSTEGEPAQYLYIVESGKVVLEMEIRIGSRTRRQVVIDVLNKNQVFGWPSLSETPVNNATATATENSILLLLDGKHIRKLCDEDAELGYKVTREMVNLVSNQLSNTKRTLAHVLSVTSHDLRAPLATIQSTLDTITGGFAGAVNSKQVELLKGAKQRAVDLMSMVDNILDISYIEIRAVDFDKVDLKEIVESSIGDVEGMATAKAMLIKNDVAQNLAPVLGLSKRLRQVMTNLLSNAVKFTPNGGTVTINSRETADNVVLEVTDTGIGIPPDEMPKIFSDFYRGQKVDAAGVGLGLAIAKKIVESHGGSIWVESPAPETGKGTKFSFTIPKVLGISQPQKGEDKSTIAGAKILVVDDEPEMRRITALVLESQGYDVSTAQNGEEALASIKKDRPDLVVLDLLMPKMDGFEVCKNIEEQQAKSDSDRIPIIILSAVREESSRRRYELETETDLKVDDYVAKPISPPVLLQRVERVLMRRKAVGATSFNITKGGKQWKDKPES